MVNDNFKISDNEHEDLREAAVQAVASYMYNHLYDSGKASNSILPTVKAAADHILKQADGILNKTFENLGVAKKL